MSLHVGTLFHWSPKQYRATILNNGLQVLLPSRLHPEFCAAYVCLGTSPSSAWALILETESEDKVGWDLWQVQVDEGDPLLIRGDFSPFVREVRVLRAMPPDRLWWVGERASHYSHDSIGAPANPAPKQRKKRSQRI